MWNLAHLHEAIAAEMPDRECLVFRDRRLSWAQMTERTRRLADVLLQHRKNRLDAPRFPNIRAFSQAVPGAHHVAAQAQAGPSGTAVGAGRFGLHPVEQ